MGTVPDSGLEVIRKAAIDVGNNSYALRSFTQAESDSFALTAPGVVAVVSVGDTAVEAKAGASADPDRKGVLLYTEVDSLTKYGFSSTTTYATGITLFKNTATPILARSTAPIYLIRQTADGTANVTVWEVL